MPKDPLKKPVHVALLKETKIRQLAKEGKLPKRLLSVDGYNHKENKLPQKKQTKKTSHPLISYQKIARQASLDRNKSVLRAKLTVLHNNSTDIPKDKIPPCKECKTAPCCYVFMVELTEEEYNSGLYGDCAVKFTHKEVEQLQGNISSFSSMGAPSLHNNSNRTQYYLEGMMGEPCLFLGKNSECTIYEKRPFTCRQYTCVGDDRITEDMRQGKVDIVEAVWNKAYGED